MRIAAQENTPLTQKEQIDVEAGQEQKRPTAHVPATSKKVTDHLANQRTFLAWIRTGLATITFGFVVERFGLLLRELGLKNNSLTNSTTLHYSAIIGVSLVLLGVITMVIALVSFLQIRRSIDEENFRPRAAFEIVLTALASLIGLLLAIYLALTA
jgi:putative membrane protein